MLKELACLVQCLAGFGELLGGDVVFAQFTPTVGQKVDIIVLRLANGALEVIFGFVPGLLSAADASQIVECVGDGSFFVEGKRFLGIAFRSVEIAQFEPGFGEIVGIDCRIVAVLQRLMIVIDFGADLRDCLKFPTLHINIEQVCPLPVPR